MDSDGSTFEKQFNKLTEKQRELYFKHLEDNAERAIADRKRVLEGFLRLCRLIDPEKVQEIEMKYPDVRLDEPGPFNELLMEIISATNLLRLSAAGMEIDLEAALQKCHDNVLSLEGQVKSERHRASQLQSQLNYVQDQLRQARDQNRMLDKGKAKKGDGEKESHHASDEPARKPSTDESDEPRKTSATSKRLAKSVEEMEMDDARATWKTIVKEWSDKDQENLGRLIVLIGSGTVAAPEIQAKLALEGEDENTTRKRLERLSRPPKILQKREYQIREKGKPGRHQKAYELTLVGKAAYRSFTGDIEKVPEDIEATAHDKTPDHADLVKRAALALTRLGMDAVANREAFTIDGEFPYDPDIKVTGTDMRLFFVEAETSGHVQSKSLGPKWEKAVAANKGSIYLVMRKRSDAESVGYGAIRKWALDSNYPEEIRVFMTGLDYLEGMEKPAKGVQSSPWFIKTMKPSTQRELLP